MPREQQDLVQELFAIEAVKFGRFLLKSGALSPIYFDLRLIISYPSLLKRIGEMLFAKIENLQFDRLCGVPYTAIPIASALSLQYDLPMLIKRKEEKRHGLKKQVEGCFAAGERCLLIEDVITSGVSIQETLETLESEGLIVSDIALILDRQQGGREKLEAKGYRLHPLITLTEVLDTLLENHKIDATLHADVRQYANL